MKQLRAMGEANARDVLYDQERTIRIEMRAERCDDPESYARWRALEYRLIRLQDRAWEVNREFGWKLRCTKNERDTALNQWFGFAA